MKIAFVGLGVFGQALASLLEYNGHKYDFAEVGKPLAEPADIVFLTTPTQFMRQAVTANRAFISNKTIIVNGSKGIEKSSHLMPHQIVQSAGRFPYYYSLMGPSFAQGIIDRDPTVVSLGYKNETHVEAIRKLLQTPYFHVQPSRGFRSLELASALKNVYAIACGYAAGLGFGPNTEAQIITIALHEFQQLVKAMHFTDYDVLAPGVVGDLVMTCSSAQSRNYTFGMNLALTGDHDPHENQANTVEGYHTSHSIKAIVDAQKIHLPLAGLTHRIIKGQSDKEAFKRFLAHT